MSVWRTAFTLEIPKQWPYNGKKEWDRRMVNVSEIVHPTVALKRWQTMGFRNPNKSTPRALLQG
jgi:hypothetical protein